MKLLQLEVGLSLAVVALFASDLSRVPVSLSTREVSFHETAQAAELITPPHITRNL